jgi:hypothetical protein
MSDSVYNHQINNDPYWFKIDLYNADGKVQSIAPTGVKSLVIEDCLYNFFHKGYIIIDNRYDAIERSVIENVQIANQGPSFVFMGDARDWIQIEITPKGDNNEFLNEKALRHSRIFIQGAIYAVEDIATDTPDVKYKKLYFWDKYYQYLREKNLYWSTAEVVENMLTGEDNASLTVLENNEAFSESITEIKNLTVKNVSNFSDGQRKIPTGQAIKNLLAAALPEDDKYPAYFPDVAFSTSNTTTTDPTIRDDDDYWDIGGSTIFFSSPARWKAIDCLSYLLSRHVSNAESGYDLAVLRLDRFTRSFTLRSLNSYFKEAYSQSNDSGGSAYLETVLLGGFGYDKDTQMVFATVADFTPKNNRFQMQQIGSTVNFALEPSVGAITQKDFVSHLIHSYNPDDKEFRVDNNFNNMEQIMDSYHTNYVDTIKSSRWASIVPGINRVNNKNTSTKFVTIEYDDVQRIAKGRNKALYTAIFANNQLRFKIQGATTRQAGMFIGVDRNGSSPANEFDQKFLGIYFITEVKHIFEGNNYYNEITAIKTYTDLQIYKGQIGPDNQNYNKQVTI